MAKERVTKSAVYNFLTKVENKAVKAIQDEYKQKYEEAVEEWFIFADGGVLFQRLHDLNNLIAKGSKLFNELNQGAESSKIKSVWKGHGWDNSDLTFTQAQIFETYAPDTCKAKAIREEWSTRENEVKSEYRKLRSLCEAARDGNTAMNLLKGLGFDVSYILQYKPDSPVDTSKLFVCNGKGAE
jgi:hypothetical protein